jgi:hypothetical protein
MPRYFTLQQATALLPGVRRDITQAVHLKQEYDKSETAMRDMARKVQMTGGSIVNRDQWLGHRSRRDALAMRLREIIESIHEAGCQIKDLDSGLLDFPTLYRGQEVLLCWRLGESAIEYWHGLEDGFRGRKPIDDDFLANHKGDSLA